MGLVENWKAELDRTNIVGVLASDMTKAFDSVCPALLINKLRAYNLSESALNLMRSYLPQRENRVRVGTVTSDWKMVRKGCPQGSTFGPLLWNVFQNDLPFQVGKANVSMYADDHQVYVGGHTSEGVVKNLVRDGERLTQWCKDNLLQVNCDKYQCMLLGCENTEGKINLKVWFVIVSLALW